MRIDGRPAVAGREPKWLAGQSSRAMTDDSSETADEEDQNQYGGSSQDESAIGQTERRDEGDVGDDDADEDEQLGQDETDPE